MGRNTRRKKITGKFTNAQNLKDLFFMNSENRRKAGDKAHGDAAYWIEGMCNWGGEHYLQKDCETLAEFFNATASVSDDVEQIKLSANEQIFNQKKQTLITKIQGLISKCQTSSTSSIAYVCCIWNDYFGSFLKPFLDTFANKLKRQLSDVQKLEPKHQQDLIKLEIEARKAENEYKENKAKTDQETDPDKKAAFMLLANKAAKKAEDIKRKVKANPLADLSRFSNLDDLTILLGGNVPKNIPSANRPSGSGGNSLPNPLNPFNQTNNPESNKQLIFMAVIACLIIFYLLNQKDNDNPYE